MQRWYNSFPYRQSVSLTTNKSEGSTSEASTKHYFQDGVGSRSELGHPTFASEGSTSRSDSARTCLEEAAHHAQQVRREILHRNSTTTVPATACMNPDTDGAKTHKVETDRMRPCHQHPSFHSVAGFDSDHSASGAMNAALQQQDGQADLYNDSESASCGASTMDF
jgi:hypothetical protein